MSIYEIYPTNFFHLERRGCLSRDHIQTHGKSDIITKLKFWSAMSLYGNLCLLYPEEYEGREGEFLTTGVITSFLVFREYDIQLECVNAPAYSGQSCTCIRRWRIIEGLGTRLCISAVYCCMLTTASHVIISTVIFFSCLVIHQA